MSELTGYERMKRMYEHRDADRVPITLGPWPSTLERWQREGLPKDANLSDYFGIDYIGWIPGIDTSPRLPTEIIEETDTYVIDRDQWGTTKKNWKPMSSTPYEIDHVIKDADSWRKAKERMTPSRDRIDWAAVDRNYKEARRRNTWIVASPYFGYDIVNARMVGTEQLLLAMADDPEWVTDALSTLADLSLALVDLIWEAGYTFDELRWYDDMGYKNGMFFSMRMWRDMVKPYQERAIAWAHRHGIKAHMHSCGNIMAVVPSMVELGLDGLNPLEVKAGMDGLGLKRQFGDKLLLQGGIDARAWDSFETVEEEIRAKLPAFMEHGGYIFGPDHSVPDSVSLETTKQVVALIKQLGVY